MHNPAEFAVRYPRIVGLGTLLCVVFGLFSFGLLPRQENPSIRDRHLAVDTYLPGAEPAKVELLVTKVLEDAIAEVDDIESIFSQSGQGSSFLLVELNAEAAIEARFQEVRGKIEEARARFPPGTSDPDVTIDTIFTHTMILVLTGDAVAPTVLRKEAKTFKRQLELLPDVRSVSLLGEPEEEIAVEVDLRALSQKGVPLSAVAAALKARNVLLPGGELPVGTLRSPLQTSGAYASVDEIGATYLGANADGLPIQLADVCTITRRLKEPDVLVRTNGRRGVSLAIQMLPHRSAIRLGEQVRGLMAEYQPTMPAGMAVHVAADEPTYVRDRLALLSNSLIVGMVLVVGLVILGMGWRSGLIVSVSIPLSLIIAMGGLSIAGIALHQISIAALVIAIGLVVDEAIVVTDNIQRHRDLGCSPNEAAVKGLGEIHTAILAGAFTTMAAFIPLGLIAGDIGDFVRSIPIAVSIMLVASVTVAHYVTPLLAAGMHWWAERGHHVRPPERHRAEPVYRKALQFVSAHSWVALVGFTLFFASSLFAVKAFLLPPVYFGEADRHQFLIRVHLPTGSPVEETDAIMRQVEARLAEHQDIADWTVYVGAGAPKFYYNKFTEGRNESRGMVVVNTKPSLRFERTPALAASLDHELKETLVGARVRVDALEQGYASDRDIEIYIQGDNLEVLRELGRRVRTVVAGVDGIENAEDSFGYDPLTLDVQVDNAKANLLGITHANVATTLRTAVDGVTATTFREDDEEIDIVVRLAAGQRGSIADLETLQVFSPRTGGTVPLAHIASLVPTWTTRSIQRWKHKREAVVSADVRDRRVIAATADIRRAVTEQVTLPSGYDISYQGEEKRVRDSMLSLGRAALLAVFLIYIILVAQFNSLVQPLLIILAIPMALTGAAWGLAITGNALGFMAFVGFISLTGIVVNDSIVLLDYINRLRRRGYALEAAVITGATTRLRPVVLTSVTTIGGLLPLSLTGGTFWAPFGYAMIFGLAASTVLTLLVQPAAYLTLERYRGRGARPSAGVEAPAPLAAAAAD